MKKLFYSIAVIAVAIATSVSCNKNETDVALNDNEVKEVVLSFTSQKPDLMSEEGTKTAWNSGAQTIYWSSSDKIRIAIKVGDNWQNASGNATSDKGPKLYVSNQAGSDAEIVNFKVSTSFVTEATGNYAFYGIYPDSCTSTDANYEHMPSINVTIPSEQTPLAGTFDPSADIMIAESAETYTAIPSDKTVSLNWTRLVAHGDITLKKLPTFEDGEVIRSITLTAQDGADLTGPHFMDLTTGAFSLQNNASAVNSVTIKASGENLAKNASGNIEFWFASLPFTATSLKAEIKTNKYIYSKQYDGISKEFKVNTRNILGISMSNCSQTDAPAEQLIENGTYVISTKYGDSDLMMVANTGSGNYQNYAELSTTVDNGKIVVDPNAAWVLTYNSSEACYYIANADTETKLSGSSGSTNLTLTANGSQFFIEEVSGGYHIKTSGSEPRWIGYNHNNGAGRFALYKDDSQQPGVVSITPAKINATPVLSISDITLPNGAAITSPVAITPSTKKYISTITVNGIYSEAECTNEVNNPWLTVTAANDQLSYTALANETGAERTLYVSVKGANDDGDETADIVFSVTQPKQVNYSNQWVLVTSESDLSEGDKIVIVNTDVTLAMSTTQNNNNRGSVSVDKDSEDDSILVLNDSDNTQQLTLGKSNNHWTLYTGAGYLYAASSSSNLLKTQTTNNANGEWTIAINASYQATITAQGTNTHNVIKNNGSLFSCYTGGQTAVKVYKWIEDTTSPKVTLVKTEINNVAAAGASSVDETGVYTLANASDANLTVTSDGTIVTAASAANGTVTYSVAANTGAARQGWVKIEVDGGNNVTINVNQLGAAYNLTIDTPANGSIEATVGGSAAGSIVGAGETVTISATPDSGYKLSAWDVYKTGDASTKVEVTYGSFVMPAYNVTVSATFVEGGDGSLQNPFTVAEAIAAYQENSSIGNKYVKGIICQEGTGKYCFMSDDGTTDTKFELYNITGSVTVSDLELGDGVIAHGTITLYNNTYEFNGCVVDVHVKKPTFDPAGGEFVESQSVEITSTGSTSIRYTTDESNPTITVGNVYSSALNLASTTTVKAVGINGAVCTGVASATYTKVAPSFSASLASGTTTASIEVAANETSATVYVTGNVAWTATPGTGVTLSKNSGTGADSFTMTFEANTDVNNPKNNTVTVSTTAGVATQSYTLTVTQKKKSNESTTTTYTFTTKDWGDSNSAWTSGKAGNQFSSGRGIQVTTGSTGANATSKSSFNSVSKVVVTYSTNANAGAGSIAVKVGSNSAHSQNVTKTGGTSDRTLEYTISPNETGSVQITVTCGTNSIYVKSVAITHN